MTSTKCVFCAVKESDILTENKSRDACVSQDIHVCWLHGLALRQSEVEIGPNDLCVQYAEGFCSGAGLGASKCELSSENGNGFGSVEKCVRQWWETEIDVVWFCCHPFPQ